MEIEKDVRELSAVDQATITGGSYADATLGVISGLAIGAAALGSAPLLGAVVVVGAGYLLWS